MSIRTKLLAATVGLNGAILILALYLFIQSEQEGGLHYEARAELARLAAVAPRPGDDGSAARRQVEQLVMRQLGEGVWRSAYVVLFTEGEQEQPLGIWRAEAFYATPDRGPEVEGDERARVARDHDRIQFHNYVLADDTSGLLAVQPAHPYNRANNQTYSIIAYPQALASGARTLYLFMIAGVIVLTAVLFWLVSKLVVHPLRDLAGAAERIAAGDYDVQVTEQGGRDELARTVTAFNRMAREIAEYQGHLEDRVLSALTRIKKAEQHLAIAQRLAATGKLAAGLAHEINNPLGGMKNAVRSLARGDMPPDKTVQYIELISEGLARVEQTVKRFLSFTPRKVEPRRTDLADVAAKAIALARHRLEKGDAGVRTELAEPGEAMVYGDAHELQQVTLNLLLNAADATAKGEHAEIVLSVAREQDEVVLEVRDNGSGMSAEDQQRCFDMFFTTKVVGEGTGLGLAIVHNIVTNHGGRIEVQSELGSGTTFRVHLPLDLTQAAEAESVRRPAETPQP
ncbi:MAG: HAMP domain-containing sensor histidine kinase [Planctomycetota bacterium]|nr:HAMP domain-containing sensor histidine kinase [Planctomycetota bacterium]